MTTQKPSQVEVDEYESLREKAYQMTLLDFMLDEDAFESAKADALRLSDVPDTPEFEGQIANACHVKLARLWLVLHGFVKTDAQVRNNLFGVN